MKTSEEVILSLHDLPVLPFGVKPIFESYLQLMHSIIVASEGLLEAALTEPLPIALHEYLKLHLEEERGHSQWLLDDMERLLIKPASGFYPGAHVAGPAYYLIKHVSPFSILGYMAALECRPMPLTSVDMLEGLYGKLGCIRHHAENDVKHGNELLEVIDESGIDGEIIVFAAKDTSIRFYEATQKMLERIIL